MNKGEWSEFYTFLRLLSCGKLYAADADLNKIESKYYPIEKVIRQSKEYKEPLFYEIEDKHIIIIDSSNNNKLSKISKEKFAINADKLLKIIKNASDSSFEAPEISNFTTELKSPLVKEKSSSKRDITLVIHDINTGYNPEVGFSIKSKLGAASTLFNANITNNIKYRIEGLHTLNSEELRELKKLKTKALIKELYRKNCRISFDSIADNQFGSNLQMIDSNFNIILSEILKLYYSGISNKINELTQKVSKENPCGIQNSGTASFYKHKIKAFLTACALGMTSTKHWDGSYNVSGGYIIVKENGEVLCYHVYNWNDFQEYLFNNTFIDTPSTTRHKFGKIEGNAVNLNFQIRFK